MRKILPLTVFSVLMTLVAFPQALENRHDPKVDINLSPNSNRDNQPGKKFQYQSQIQLEYQSGA